MPPWRIQFCVIAAYIVMLTHDIQNSSVAKDVSSYCILLPLTATLPFIFVEDKHSPVAFI